MNTNPPHVWIVQFRKNGAAPALVLNPIDGKDLLAIVVGVKEGSLYLRIGGARAPVADLRGNCNSVD